MAWMMEPASLIFLTDVVLLFSKSVHFNATIKCMFYYSQKLIYLTLKKMNNPTRKTQGLSLRCIVITFFCPNSSTQTSFCVQ